MKKLMSMKQSAQNKLLEKSVVVNSIVGKTYNKVLSSKFCATLIGLYWSIFAIMPAMATSDAISEGIKSGTEQIWKVLVAIVAPLGAVALAIQAIKILWGGQRAAEEAKSAAIKIIVAIAIVLLAPSLVGVIKGWFKEASWNF